MIRCLIILVIPLVCLGQNQAPIDYEDELKFALAPNMSLWENLLLPTPSVVTMIGKMVVLSTKVDVSLEDAAPEGGRWQYVRHPSSLRASLLQVSNDAWDAFNTAHTNMDAVQLNMIQVPRFVKMAVKILRSRRINLKALSRLLPIPLKRIERAGTHSVELALEAKKAFLDVKGLTAELSETVADKHGQTDQKLVLTKTKKAASEAAERLWEEERQRRQQLYKEQADIVKGARAQYEQAIRDLPTGWKAMAMDIVRGVTNLLTLKFLGGTGSAPSGDGTTGGNAGSQPRFSMDDRVIQGLMNEAVKRIPAIMDVLKLMTSSSSNKSVEDSVKGGKMFRAMTIIFSNSRELVLKCKDTPQKQLAVEAIGKLLEACEPMAEKLKESVRAPEDLEEFAADAIEAMKEASSKANELLSVISTGQNVMDGGSGGSGSWSVGGGSFRNERFKIKMELQRLDNEEQRLDNLNIELQNAIEQLIEVETELSQLRLEEVNLEQILELLRKVLKILGIISELWSKLVEFFQMVAVRAQLIDNAFLKPFVESTQAIRENLVADGDDSQEIRQMYVEFLIEQAEQVSIVSYFLHTMSKTYVQVSQRFVLSQLAGFAQLLAAKNDEERTQSLESLDRFNQNARQGITGIISQTRAEYRGKMNEKRAEMTALLGNIDDAGLEGEIEGLNSRRKRAAMMLNKYFN